MKRGWARAALPAACAVLLSACAGRTAMSDWERDNQDRLAREAVAREATPAAPAFPQPKDLAEFPVAGANGFHFFVDRASLSVGEGGVVRYTLLARSPSGAENITYDGARCETGEHRIYATGYRGAWQAASGAWRPMVQRWDVTLHREYFCPQGVAIRSAAEGRRALEQGGHPFARGFGGDPYERR